MIVYQATKERFVRETDDRGIEYAIAAAYLKKTGRYAPDAEVRAWRNSLVAMAAVLGDEEIPGDSGVGIEFGIPQTSKRIDFLLSGRSAEATPHVIVIELKQWSSAKRTAKDGIVLAHRGGKGESEGAHPCYQAWSYAALLEGFNEAIYEGGVSLRPCAYLHNHPDGGDIKDAHYSPYLEKAPLFLAGNAERQRLQTFIKQHIRHGDNADILVQIENGRIRPSKMLADSLGRMLKGNDEFVLIDDQKVVYETALAVSKRATADRKQVAIIQGGPGTGKSVVAINLLVALSKLGLLSKYVSKNAAPREVYKSKLRGDFRQVEISNFFAGSGGFIESEPNVFDVLVVDEAHRLNAFSGLYGNLGENQVKELIAASKCTLLFVDDDQMVTLNDIGHSSELERWAKLAGAEVTHLELTSQFRCNGSNGYLTWLDNTLGVRETAHQMLDTDDYDFRVLDSPTELHALIAKKNAANNKSRVVAGYCWDWVSKRNPEAYDIIIPEHDYRRQWNLSQDGSLWIISPTSVDEVGCIHTCQGLELDYVGVIIGADLQLQDGVVTTHPDKRSSQDRSIRGWRTAMRGDPAGTTTHVERIIRNTYKTLMSRGMKGCYVYCVDANLRDYFRGRIAEQRSAR